MMNEFVFAAFAFGLTSGIKPGPLGIFVIQQTLTYGLRQGIRASLAPIITDGPIIFVALVLLSQFKDISAFVGILSLIGGLYLLHIALKILKLKDINVSQSLDTPTSFATAIKINFLNPNPYLFWFTVGGAYLARGSQAESIAFVVVVLGTLMISKVAVAWIASNFRGLLDSDAYLWVMRILGGALSIFGFLLLNQAYQALF
jgi:threonine/homoserine/homoserine lactone efflux protein